MFNLGGWKMIREFKKSGLNVTAIAKQLNLDRKTVRKAIYSDFAPKEVFEDFFYAVAISTVSSSSIFFLNGCWRISSLI
jgi:hypothetical protein